MPRSTVSKSDLSKVAAFLKDLGLVPVTVEVLPGRVRLEMQGGDEPTPAGDEASERAKERWVASGTRKKPAKKT